MGRQKSKFAYKELLAWRREQVRQMWFKGWDITRIAEVLKVTPKVVYDDEQYIEKHAEDIMRNYLSNTVPHMVNRSIERLEMANAKAWDIIENTEDKRTQLGALQVISKTAIDSVTIVAGIRDLINFALDKDKYVQALQNIESLSANKQSDQQTEEEEESEVNNNNNDSSDITSDTEGETEEQSSESAE